MSEPFKAPLFDYESRILCLLGPVEPPDFDLLVDQLLRLDAESEHNITLFVSSQGGTMVEALKVIDTIGLLRCKLTVVGFGLVEGAGVLLIACAHQRILFPSAVVSTAGVWDLPQLHAQARAGIGLNSQPSLDDELCRCLSPRIAEVLISAKRSSVFPLFKPSTAARLFTSQECLDLDLADAVIEGPRRLLNKYLKRKRQHEHPIPLSH
jgi:Clp protease